MGVVAAGLYLKLSSFEFVLICITITSVLAAEMANTAVESLVDLVTKNYHPLARRVKDISAGAVLLVAINACIVGYLLLLRRFVPEVGEWASWVMDRPWQLSLAALVLVLIVVVFMKGMFHRGSPLRGGMPSGHAAVAFSAWVTCSLMSMSGLVSFLSLVLALLVAQSRVRKKIHNEWEVTAGAILGTLITVMIFQIFS